MSAAEAQPHRDPVTGAEDVGDLDAQVGKPLPHRLHSQGPDLAAAHRLGQPGQVGDEILGEQLGTCLQIAALHQLEAAAKQLDVLLGGHGWFPSPVG